MASANVPADKSVADDVLQCPLCLHPLEFPVTLQQCLHNYCKDCLGEIPQTSKDDVTGWMCPKCNRFSSAEDVKENDFIEKLIMSEKVDDKVKDPVTCKQCSGETDVKWQCEDCRIELCSSCHVNHIKIPMLKHHVIVELDTSKASNNVVDELLFCNSHKDRLIELNCKDCEVPLCVLCNVEEHDTHTTETINNALKRLVPEMEQKSEILATEIVYLENKVEVIRSKIQETKNSYAETKQKVHLLIEHLISELRKIESEQEEVLKVEEMASLGTLEEIKLELEQQIEETKHLWKMTSLTLKCAQNSSLLQQLQDGLANKVQVSSEIQFEPLLLSFQNCMLTSAMEGKKMHIEMQRLFGKLKRMNIKSKVTREGQILDNHYLCQNICDCINDISHIPMKTVKCLGCCDRFSLVDGHIYVPSDQKIAVYDLDGSLMTDVEVPFYPCIIKKVPYGQLAVGSLSGLYLFDTLSQADEANKIADGEYSDIDVYGDTFYALRCDTSEIVTLKLSGTEKVKHDASTQKSAWHKERRVKLSCISETHNCNTFCRQEDTYLVSSIKDECIFICDMLGTLLKTILANKCTSVCGVDQDENIIIADYHNNLCFAYDVKQGIQMSLLQSLPGRPTDVLVDNAENVWVLVEQEGDQNLVKYIHKMDYTSA